MNKLPMWLFSNRRRGETHPNAKLSNDDVLKIRDLYKKGFSINVIARNFKVSQWTIKEIVEGKTWTHL